MTRVVSITIAIESLTFLVAAILHAGIQVPLLSVFVHEPRIRDAVVVEAFCALLLGASFVAILARSHWAPGMTIVGHIVAIGGVLLGMAALAHGLGPTTMLNYVYHRTILVVLVMILAISFLPGVRVPDEIWAEAARHYDEKGLAALIIAIASINLWNRLNVATKQAAGKYASSAEARASAHSQSLAS